MVHGRPAEASEWAGGREASERLAAIVEGLGLRPAPFDVTRPEDSDIKTIEELEAGFDKSGLLVYGGEPALVYIRDHTVMTPDPLVPERCRRLHFTVCETLLDMRARGRFQRYRKTTSGASSYVIDMPDGRGGAREVRMRLLPCQHCLGNARYAGFCHATMNRGERMGIVRGFDTRAMLQVMTTHLREFSARPSRRPFDRLAEVTRRFIVGVERLRAASEPTGYGPEWREVSLKYRRKMEWQCECCGVRLDGPGHHHLLDTHHRNGDKRDNRDANLEALCKLCHRAKGPHYGVGSTHAEKIRAAWREQGIRVVAGAGHRSDGSCGHA